MALEAETLDVVKKTVQEAVTSGQERLAQMVARQFVELRTALQDIQESLGKLGNRQVQLEADMADVGRTCEVLKRRLQDLHTELMGEAPAGRKFSHRLDRLEQEVAEIRQRLSSAV